MAASTAPLLTIPAMEKIETFVEDIPSDVLAFHGGAEKLTKILTDLLFPRRKRGRPLGSKNNPKDALPEITKTPRKRGRPLGSKNNPKPTDVSKEVMLTPKKQLAKISPKTPDAPVKRRDKHTRKSKKSTAAATLIQRAWRASQ